MSHRWGKPRKNVKRRDPRYFLYESLNQDEELLKKIGDLDEREILSRILSKKTIDEQEEKSLAPTDGEPRKSELSPKLKSALINTARRIVLQVVSSKLRIGLGYLTVQSVGALPVILKLLGYGPTKLWQVTSVDNLDRLLEIHLDHKYVEKIYSGEISLSDFIILLVREVVGKEILEKEPKTLTATQKDEIKKVVKKAIGEVPKEQRDDRPFNPGSIEINET